MTTRRGFIQGVLVAIGAAVMPKMAVAEVESATFTIPHMKAPLIDNVGLTIDLDEQGMSIGDFARATMYYPGGCAEWHLPEPGWDPEFVIATQAADCKLTIHGNDWTWPDDEEEWTTVVG